MVNYPKTEAVVFGLPAAATAATIQIGSNSVAVKPQFKYVGSIVQADGGQDRELQSFPLLLAIDVGGLGFEFCVFVAGWKHALRSEWPFIIIISIKTL